MKRSLISKSLSVLVSLAVIQASAGPAWSNSASRKTTPAEARPGAMVELGQNEFQILAAPDALPAGLDTPPLLTPVPVAAGGRIGLGLPTGLGIPAQLRERLAADLPPALVEARPAAAQASQRSGDSAPPERAGTGYALAKPLGKIKSLADIVVREIDHVLGNADAPSESQAEAGQRVEKAIVEGTAGEASPEDFTLVNGFPVRTWGRNGPPSTPPDPAAVDKVMAGFAAPASGPSENAATAAPEPGAAVAPGAASETGSKGSPDSQLAPIRAFREGFAKAVHGQEAMREAMLMGILTGGHILLNGVPGVAKTRGARAVAALTDLKYRRIQFTPDLQPFDITGQAQRNLATGEWEIRKGPVFTNILLADEINRAPPKTQSALLEAMAELRTTVEGTEMELPSPFVVLATMNPIEHEGTYALPEAQVDRFLMQVLVDNAPEDSLPSVTSLALKEENPNLPAAFTIEELTHVRAMVRAMEITPQSNLYIARLVAATRKNGKFANDQVKKYVQRGASDRAAILLAKAARAQAFLRGGSFTKVQPIDVQAVAVSVLAHRLQLEFKARTDNVTAEKIVESLIRGSSGTVPIPDPPPDTHKAEAPAAQPAATVVALAPQAQVPPAQPAFTATEKPRTEAAPASPSVSAPLTTYEKFRAGLPALAFTIPYATLPYLMGIKPQPQVIANATGIFALLLGLWQALSGSYLLSLGMFTMAVLALPSELRERHKRLLLFAVPVAAWFVRGLWDNDAGRDPNDLGFGGVPFHLLHAAGEEAMFRAAVFLPLFQWLGPKLNETLRFWLAAGISSALFAVAHFSSYGFEPCILLVLFASGIVLSWLYHQTKDLRVPILVHALHNITPLTWYPLAAAAAALLVMTSKEYQFKVRNGYLELLMRAGAWGLVLIMASAAMVQIPLLSWLVQLRSPYPEGRTIFMLAGIMYLLWVGNYFYRAFAILKRSAFLPRLLSPRDPERPKP